MEQSLSHSQLAAYTAAQMNLLFPDPNPVSPADLERLLPGVMQRMETCFSGLASAKYFKKGGVSQFNHLNGDQYAMYTYLLSNEAFRSGDSGRDIAVKGYLLNKALYGIEVFYEVELPPVFCFMHAIGTVLGRAKYGNGLVVTQGVTVGNKNSQYPVLGEKVVLCAKSTVLGDCRLGDRVCVGAGSQLIDETIPDGSTVVGCTPNIRVLPKQSSLVDLYFNESLAHV